MNLIDLHDKCSCLRNSAPEKRVYELSSILPHVSVVAIGGFPIKLVDGALTWCGSPATAGDLKYRIVDALGLSAVLTYTNKSEMSLQELGYLCLGKKHLWGAHWINVTLAFARYSLAVQMAFACDRRFYLSWPIEKEITGLVFTATGGLKEWGDYLAHRDDKSFDSATREAMTEAFSQLKELLP
jgi:hypothetical protein